MAKNDSDLARRLVLHIIVNAIAIAITTLILPGITVVNNDIGTYILIGAVFGLVNTTVKPLITCLTCALVVVTFGLFIFVINGLMLWITAGLLPDRLEIDGFGWAMLGGFIMAIVATFLQSQFGLDNNDTNGNGKVRVVYMNNDKHE